MRRTPSRRWGKSSPPIRRGSSSLACRTIRTSGGSLTPGRCLRMRLEGQSTCGLSRMCSTCRCGWRPSLGGHYLRPEDVSERQEAVDEAARAADRDPVQIERAVNVMALEGAPGSWSEQLARIATGLRFSTMLVGVPSEDPVGFVRRLGEDVAPRVRELIG